MVGSRPGYAESTADSACVGKAFAPLQAAEKYVDEVVHFLLTLARMALTAQLGVPPKFKSSKRRDSVSEDLYQTLGVGRDATKDEIMHRKLSSPSSIPIRTRIPKTLRKI